MGKIELTDLDYLFESERLGFRRFKDSDLNEFYMINSDKEVMKHFPSMLSKQDTLSFIGAINQHIKDHGYGFFSIDHLKDKKFIGFIGFKNVSFEAEFTPAIEIGWRLKRSYWNKGLATEGAKRCLEFAFNDLELVSIYSFTALLNHPSERVMQKIGMNRIGEFDHPALAEGHPLQKHCLYRINSH